MNLKVRYVILAVKQQEELIALVGLVSSLS